MRKLLAVILGLAFAMMILPRLAKMSFAAKYRKSGVAYAADANGNQVPVTSCSDVSSPTTNIGQVALKIKCRGEMPEN